MKVQIKNGDSFTIGIVFDESYDTSRLVDLQIAAGQTVFGSLLDEKITLDGEIYRAALPSEFTAELGKMNYIYLSIYDELLGVKTYNIFTLLVDTDSIGLVNDSENEGYDITVPVSLSENDFVTDDLLLATVFKGEKGDKGDAGGGEGGTVTPDNVAAAIDLFTISTPQTTDYIALGSKKKSLVSALITLIQNSFALVFSAYNHNHSLANLTEKSYNSLTDKPTIPTQYTDAMADARALLRYTADEKTKLAGLDSNHWRGKFASEALLNAIAGVSGDYAAVDTGAGTDVVQYIWDDNDMKWVKQLGISTAETAASIKSKYESNADTNCLTNQLKTNYDTAYTNNHTHSNKSILDSIEQALTTALKSAYDGAVTWISTNGTNLLNHLTNTSNPHNVTASQTGAITAISTDTLTNKTLNSNTNYIDANALHVKVFCDLGGAATILMPVYFDTWNVANSAVIVKKAANGGVKCNGLMESAGADGTVQSVRTSGLIEGTASVNVNTSSFSEGALLYVGTSGTLTATKPLSAPQAVCKVLRSHATLGVVDVHIEEVEEVRVGFSAINSNTSIISTSAPVSFTEELEDTHAAFDGTIYTVPAGQGGMWSISSVYTFASVTDGKIYLVGLSVNSSSTTHISHMLGRGISGGAGLCGAGGNIKIPLNAGDTIQIKCNCGNNTTGYNTIPGYCSFSAYKMI